MLHHRNVDGKEVEASHIVHNMLEKLLDNMLHFQELAQRVRQKIPFPGWLVLGHHISLLPRHQV